MDFGLSQNYSVQGISEEIIENADLIIRASDQVHDISSTEKIVSSYSYAYTIVKPTSKHLGNVAVYYQNNISKIKNLEIRYYDSTGKEIKKIKKKDLTDSNPHSNISMVDDIRYIRYSNHYIKYPYTVEVSFIRDSKYAASLPSFNPYPYGSSHKTYVEKSSYSIIGSSEDLEYKVKNIDTFSDYISIESLPKKITVSNLPIYETGAYSPPDDEFLPSVQFSRSNAKFNTTNVQFNDWESYGKWMFDAYLNDKYELSDDTKKTVKEIIKGKTSNYEMAEAIYNYVVNNTRYVSIQLGEGGLEPFYAEDVHQKKYGDCKALSMYTLALLNVAGVPSFYTVIQADTDATPHFEKDFASIAQGNHIIIGIENGADTIYADCTSSNVPFGIISSFTDGRWAVGVNQKGGKLIKTPKYSDKENSCIIESSINVDPISKLLKVEVQSEITGHKLSNRIAFNKYSNKIKEEKVLPYLYPEFSKETFQDLSMEYSGGKFQEEFYIETKKFVSTAGNYIMVPLHLHKLEVSKISEKNRTVPIYFKDGYKTQFQTTINVPEGYEWTGDIEKQILKSTFGSFELKKVEQINNAVEIEIELQTKSGYFSKDLVEEFNEWIEGINKLENTKVIFRPLKK